MTRHVFSASDLRRVEAARTRVAMRRLATRCVGEAIQCALVQCGAERAERPTSTTKQSGAIQGRPVHQVAPLCRVGHSRSANPSADDHFSTTFSRLSRESLSSLHSAFAEYDEEGDGSISVASFALVLSRFGHGEADAQAILPKFGDTALGGKGIKYVMRIV